MTSLKTIAFTLSTALLALGAAPAEAARGHRYRDHGSEWKSLGVVQTGGREDTLAVDRRAGRIDDLRIEATRGSVDLTSVVVTARDGRRYALPVHQHLRAGSSHFLRLPGPAQRIASIELNYATPRGAWWRRAFARNRAELAVLAR
jgi:hypothetical protein